MEKNLTAESQKEIFLYVCHPELFIDIIIIIITIGTPVAITTLACCHHAMQWTVYQKQQYWHLCNITLQPDCIPDVNTVEDASMATHLIQCRLLNLLTWRIGCLLLCGFSALTSTFPFVSTFAQLPVARRELVMQSWATSSIPQFRKVCLSAFLLVCPHTVILPVYMAT